jgi:peptide/nickel transport system substrate-binding protein
VSWLRKRGFFAAAVLGTAALVTLAVLAITGSVLSRVHEIEGAHGGTLTVVSLEGAPDLDPARINDVYGTMIARAVDRTPYTFRADRNGELEPDLAEGTPEISDDSRQVTITIRSGVHFSAPVDREVTARDVAYGIARGFLPGVDSPAAHLYFGDVQGVAAVAAGRATLPSGLRTPDDNTLQIHLAAPTGRLVAGALTLPLAAPVPPEYARRFDRLAHSTYDRHQVFTGPYRIAAGPGGLLPPADAAQLILQRNPSWDAGEDFRPAFADRIVLEQHAPGPAALAQRVLGGRAAVSSSAPRRSDLDRALRTRRAQVALPPAGEITFIALNTRMAPFRNADVRRAVSAALDQDAVRAALGGVAVGFRPTHWIPPGVPGFAEAGGRAGPDADFLAYGRGNLALARRYLRRAGYAAGRITGLPALDLVARRDAAGTAFAAATRRALAALGLRSRVRFLALGPFAAACARAPGVAACLGYRWQRDLNDAASVLPPLFGAEGLHAGTNVSRLADPTLERLMAKAASTTGAADRAHRWADVDRRVTDLAPGVPIVWNRDPNLRSADVKGVLDPDLAAWSLSFTSLRAP